MWIRTSKDIRKDYHVLAKEKWVNVDVLSNWINDKIKKVEKRSQPEPQKKSVIYCLENLNRIITQTDGDDTDGK